MPPAPPNHSPTAHRPAPSAASPLRPSHPLQVLTARRRMLAVLIVAMVMLGGCQAPGYLLEVLLPPEKTPAAYNPEDRRTVVFVDDPSGVLPQSSHRTAIAAAVERELQHEEIITDFVSTRELDELRLNEDGFSSWPIDRVGRRVEAEQVIYVLLEQFETSDPEDTYRPLAKVRVKLIDAEAGERVFPENDDMGKRVTTRMFFHPQQDRSRGTNAVLRGDLARHTGEDVARLFFDSEPRPVGSGFDD